MQNLFQPEAVAEVISRIDKLQPATQHLWGKMDVAQMMAHCSATLDVASGRILLPRLFIGRILGPFVRPLFTNDNPFSKNCPTDKAFVIADQETSLGNRNASRCASGSFTRAGKRNAPSIRIPSSAR